MMSSFISYLEGGYDMRYASQCSCVVCRKDLTRSEVMNSYGRCPLCGYKSPNAGTIVKCNERRIKVFNLREKLIRLFIPSFKN